MNRLVARRVQRVAEVIVVTGLSSHLGWRSVVALHLNRCRSFLSPSRFPCCFLSLGPFPRTLAIAILILIQVQVVFIIIISDDSSSSSLMPKAAPCQ